MSVHRLVDLYDTVKIIQIRELYGNDIAFIVKMEESLKLVKQSTLSPVSSAALITPLSMVRTIGSYTLEENTAIFLRFIILIRPYDLLNRC